MAECLKLVKEKLATKKINRDADVNELYLADSKLEETIDMSRFKNLQYLWLNGNKLRHLGFLNHNYRLCELYLQNNCLIDISSGLAHLVSLQILFLHNNQLEKLEKVVNEIKKMNYLTTLNLFDNPVAQEKEYRSYVIYHVPSVTLLDRKEVLLVEQQKAHSLYNQTAKEVSSKIGFGRRSEGDPALYYPVENRRQNTTPEKFEVGNNFYRDKSQSGTESFNIVPSQSEQEAKNRCLPFKGHSEKCECINPLYSPPFDTEDQAVKVRHLQRSVMEYSVFDWSKVPRAEERRLKNKPFDKPQVISTRFR